MATTAPTIVQLDPHDGSVFKYTWVLTGTNDGAPLRNTQWADRTVQIGTAADTWAAGTVVWEGSNDDGLTWLTLTDAQASAITKTGNALEQVVEITQLARPPATVSVTQVTVYAVMRRQQPLRS